MVKFLPIGLVSKELLMALQNKATLDPECYPQWFSRSALAHSSARDAKV